MFRQFIKKIKYLLVYREISKLDKYKYLTKSNIFNNKDLFIDRVLHNPIIFIYYNDTISSNRLAYKNLYKDIKDISNKYKTQINICQLTQYGKSPILRLHI